VELLARRVRLDDEVVPLVLEHGQHGRQGRGREGPRAHGEVRGHVQEIRDLALGARHGAHAVRRLERLGDEPLLEEVA